LRCRCYNSTQLTLLNLTFNAKLRRPTVRDGDWSLRNCELELTNRSWAIALPFVPLSIRIGLDRNDIDFDNSDDNKLCLKTLQGHPFEPMVNDQTPHAKSFFVIDIDGTIDESDSHLLESLWWPIDKLKGTIFASLHSLA
jgi:hypothetical protein